MITVMDRQITTSDQSDFETGTTINNNVVRIISDTLDVTASQADRPEVYARISDDVNNVTGTAPMQPIDCLGSLNCELIIGIITRPPVSDP